MSIHIISGLKYLHNQTPPVQHGDLKPDNILVCKNIAKICDFGLSKARETVSRATFVFGTVKYSPPEFFTGRTSGPSSDIYSFALVVWAMTSGREPYVGMNPQLIMSHKLRQKLPSIPPSVPAKMCELLMSCLEYTPTNRPCAEIVEAMLGRIEQDPGLPSSHLPTPVKDMKTPQLVEFLEQKNVLDRFVSAIGEMSFSGTMLLQLQKDYLVRAPFNLTPLEAMLVMQVIEQIKQD